MNATVIVSMLCFHLLCFGVMFLLISQRLQGEKLGMDVCALGNAMLGATYALQLWEGGNDWTVMSAINHALTVCVPVVYTVSLMRFFGRSVSLWKPLLGFALAYAAVQALVQWTLGSVARYALLSGTSALMFAVMSTAALYGMRTFARDLRAEMVLFAVLIGGLGVLNAMKFVKLLAQGLTALDMDSDFQMVFYVYMSFMATVLAPSMIWLVMRRLTDQLREKAAHDSLTHLLNRRGLLERLEGHFQSRLAGAAHLLMVDVDHFKRINDTYGHKAGDLVLQGVADVLRHTLRHGDLACRAGGEEFVVICLDADTDGALLLAARVRSAIERHEFVRNGSSEVIRCTVTIGVSQPFFRPEGLDVAMQQADAALYRGKSAGRNRVEQACVRHAVPGTDEVKSQTTMA